MAKGRIKGITFEIGGDTTKLGKALSDVDGQLKNTQGNLRDVERALKMDPGNSDLLKQKQRLLGDEIERTKEKLEILKQADKTAKQQLASGDIGQDDYEALQREIIKTESSLKSYGEQLKKIPGPLDKIAEKMGSAGKKMVDVGESLSMKVTAPIAAAGVAAFKMGSDLEDAFGATEQIFKGAADEVKNWADNLESYYGIAEGEALNYANTMGAMLQNIGGLSEKEAAKQSEILVQLAGDLTAMFGGTTESAVQALTGALKGNTSMLDNYGMGVNDATIKAKALEMGLMDEGKQLDLAGKQAATLALIMEQTADAQGQASREADGASGSTRALATELKNIAGDIGQILLPIVTPLLTSLKEMVQRFGEMSPETQEMIVKIAMFAAALGPALVVVGKMTTGIGAVIKAVKGVGGALSFLSAGPLGLILLAIAAVIAIGVLLYKNWDKIKEAAGKLGGWISDKWNGIKEHTKATWNNVKDTISGGIKKASDGVKNELSNMKKAFDEKGGGIKGVAAAVMTSVNERWKTGFAALNKLSGGKLGELASSFKSKFDDIKSRGGNMMDNLKEGIRGGIDRIKSFFNFSWSLPKIKMPHFRISGRFSLNPPSIPSFGVDWYDKGGIFSGPSVIGVGEKRPEFVGALDDLRAIVREESASVMNGQMLEVMQQMLELMSGTLPQIAEKSPIMLDGREITDNTENRISQRRILNARSRGKAYV